MSDSITATEKCTFSAFPIIKPKGIDLVFKEVKVKPGSSCSSKDPDATVHTNQPRGSRGENI